MSDPIPVIWLSLHEGIDARGPWDTQILEYLFAGSLWPHWLEFEHCEGIGTYPTINYKGFEWTKHAPAIVVIPARHHCSPEDITTINDTLSAFTSVLLILCGDEEGKFPWRDIQHPNVRFWVQMPDPQHHGDMSEWAYFFGNGWGNATKRRFERLVRPGGTRAHAWSFAGQVTHPRRLRAANGLAKCRIPGVVLPTKGFAQGVGPDEYARLLLDSWIAICPGGPQSNDTFRLYEALEAGCIPIVDSLHPRTGLTDRYWEMALPSVPLTKVQDWEGVGGLIEALYARKEFHSAQCRSAWGLTKRGMALQLVDDLEHLGVEVDRPHVTAIVTTSPVASNPSLAMIVETIKSIPPDVPVIIACDGVRPEQEHMTKDYEMFLYHLAEWASAQSGVAMSIGDSWQHQALTTRRALDLVDTPAILFMEHDTPLVTDESIDWARAVEVVAEGFLDVLRFHHESHVLAVHERLMIDHQTTEMLGLPIRRTRQWSQRPHLANTGYYRRVLHENFSTTSRTMIEDKMHSVAQSQPGHRLAIYHPDTGNIKRSYHLDGRGAASKFEMRFQ